MIGSSERGERYDFGVGVLEGRFLGKRFTFHGRRNVRAVPLDNDAHSSRQR